MKNNLLPSIILTLCCIGLFCGVYTVAMLGIAQLAPNGGRGEIILVSTDTTHRVATTTHRVATRKYYYTNIGQKFTDDKYFWSRPSAVDYNGAGSGGSNKGPTNPDYLAQVQSRIDTFLAHNPGVKKSEIPSELVTASGSGQDPNLSPQGAMVQVSRIAKTRNIQEEKLFALINEHVEKPLLNLFGTTKVNVLKLNLALDNLK
ncbi:MAG: potassium-transporting ATPase subunit C [Chitinophagales bacterium]|nr:potassium-transporting ATPase subunit C [Chitinophagaceae bacterium]MBP9882652.1 potassium-transporting ATPase subunit C [Chitinophagales bacterium]